MINLLPHELKQEYRFARRNRRLLGWLGAFALAIAGVVVITAIGLLVMQHDTDSYNERISSAQNQLASEDSTGVAKQVTTMSNNLNLMVKLLSQEVLFSKLLTRLGQVTPSGVVLTNLTITQDQVGIDINAQATNYDPATQLQANLVDPANQVFSKADIVSISCGGSGANATYPCNVTIRAQLANNSPFLFINATKANPS